jgi:putative transposase
VADQLVNGVRFRALTVLDVCTREALAIQGGRRFRTEDVVAVCSRIAAKRAYPARVFVDNGSEFSGRVFDLWAHHQKTAIDPADRPTTALWRRSMDHFEMNG